MALQRGSSLAPMPVGNGGSFLLVPRAVPIGGGRVRNFSDGDLATLVTEFKSLRRGLVIDYEHQTLLGVPGFEHKQSADGTAPAAGWIGDLLPSKDGLMAMDVSWTPKGRQSIASGAYSDCAPTLFWNGEPWHGSPAMLGPAGLTNGRLFDPSSATAARASSGAATGLQPISRADGVSRSQSFLEAPLAVQRLHLAACQYADSNGVSYSDALRALGPGCR